ncbi:MAG TPA: MASE1 domain-containing protein [Gemmatimonadaceae bacterium]|nr:MASE1 domain-containing protein [Gemmatimonadaceae bacterium]
MPTFFLPRSLRRALPNSAARAKTTGLIFLAYGLVGNAGLHLAAITGNVPPVWPASAVALVGLTLWGLNCWPGVFAAAAVGSVTAHVPALPALLMSTGVTVEAVFGAWLLRFADVSLSLDSVVDVLKLWLFGGIVASAIGASIGVIALVLAHQLPWSLATVGWRVWYLGDVVGVVLAAPLLMTAATREAPTWTRARAVEFAGLTVFAVVAAGVAFDPKQGYPYLPFLPLLWAVLRFDLRGPAITVFLVSMVAIWKTAHGSSQFSTIEPHVWIMELNRFIIVYGMTGLVGGSLSERQRRATVELATSEEKFRKAFNSSPLPNIIVSPHTRRIVDVNDLWLQMFEWRREEVVGRCTTELGLWPDREAQDGYRELVLQQSVRGYEATLTTRTGVSRRVLLSSVPVEIGGAYCVLTSYQDLTELQHLQEEFLQAQKMEAIGQLSGGIAHDFNNLLMVILGITGLMLADNPLNDAIRSDLEQIDMSAQHAAALTAQLLAFGRRQIMQVETVRVDDLIEECGTLLRRILGEDIVLALELGDEPAWTRADRGQVSQVIMNLAVNARDAMPSGGRLTISSGVLAPADASRMSVRGMRDEPHVFLRVSDTGTGMAPEIQGRIFEPFFTTKAVGRGTGLGLSTVYGIIKQLGGDIAVDSELGRGTTFTIVLPAASPDAYEMQVPRAPETRQGHGTILVVEDEAPVRAVLRRVLVRAGYEVITAVSGADALSVDLRRAPDLLLTDIVMPDIGGVELAHTLRQRWPELPVLLMSGYQPKLAEGDMNAHSAFPVLAKPFPLDELTRCVGEMLKPA